MGDENLNQWFIREILVHERSLVRFLTRAWPDRSEIDDICHDTYVRVYEAAEKSRPASPRGFLFTTARNLLADRVRRGRIVSIEVRSDLDSLNVLVDDLSPERRANASQELWRLMNAFGSMPKKCRVVMWLIKVEELSRKEIAARLGITPKAVEKRIERGVRLLQEAYFGDSALSHSNVEAEIRRKTGHG